MYYGVSVRLSNEWFVIMIDYALTTEGVNDNITLFEFDI